jgi:restriction system protein
MSVPTYDRFIEPILRYLAEHPNGAAAKDVHEAVAGVLQITDADKQELLPSGGQRIYKNRAGWAHDRLKRAGLSNSSHRGYWQLTPEGVEFAKRHQSPLSDEEIERIATSFMEVRLRAQPETELVSPVSFDALSQANAVASPDDRLEEALQEIRRKVATEILEALGSVSDTFFETIVLNVVHKMGYGGSRAALQRVGGPGDAGIDGVISLDKLGLEKVYIQAKHWQQSVGRPEVQAFYGALAGQHAKKGLFITTSSFTVQAREFVRSVEGIVLVDGSQLADLMIEHEVGVTSRDIKVPKIDNDYFDEEVA